MAEKITKSRHYYHPKAVCLFLEDLEDISAVIRDEADNRPIEISDDEYRYDSLDDLRKKRGSILYRLKIETASKDFELDLSDYHCSLASRDAKRFINVQQILQKRTPERLLWHENAVPSLISIICIVVLGIVSIILIDRFISFHASVIRTVVVTTLGLFIGPFLGNLLYSAVHFKTVIYLFPSHERQSFWSRNKDKLLFELVKVVGAGVVGWFLHTLYQSLK